MPIKAWDPKKKRVHDKRVASIMSYSGNVAPHFKKIENNSAKIAAEISAIAAISTGEQHSSTSSTSMERLFAQMTDIGARISQASEREISVEDANKLKQSLETVIELIDENAKSATALAGQWKRVSRDLGGIVALFKKRGN